MFVLSREGSELEVVVQDTRGSSKQTIQFEVNLVNIRPSTSKCLLLHRRGEHTLWSEADILSHDRLALTLASQGQRASKRHAGKSLLRRSDAAEVEALQGEVDRFAAGWLESRGVVESRGEDVLDGDVWLALRGDSDGCESDVDDVKAVPGEAFVHANGLQRCYWDSDSNIVEL